MYSDTESSHFTCKDGRFEQLDKLVNLYEHVDCHFELGTSRVSRAYVDWEGQATIFAKDCKPVRRLELEDIARKLPQRYSTKT
jgi:hypothetical protein